MELQPLPTSPTNLLPLLRPPSRFGRVDSTPDNHLDSPDGTTTAALIGNVGQPGRASADRGSADKQASLDEDFSAPKLRGDYARASDDQLLAAAKSEDGRAFEELSGRYIRAMRKRVYSIVRNPEDAEDVVQDSLLKAYRHLQEFRESCEFSTWITRIATNTALMVLRKRRSRPEVSLYQASQTDQTWTIDDFPDPSPSAERAYARREMLDFVKRAVNRLPPLYRCVLEQYHGQEKSMRDAAASLGITVETAKSRLFRARRTLRSRLERQQISAAGACY